MKSFFVLILATLLGCAASVPSVTNIGEYRSYISKLDDTIRTADEESFAESERSEIIVSLMEINSAIDTIQTFDELDPDQQASLIALNNRLHEQIIGFEGNLSSQRICRTESSINSHISSRVCRTRDQLTRERASARDFLRGRSDGIDQVFADERFNPNDTIVGHERDF